MNKKYIPIVGMFYGIPFIKNPTEPTNFKTTLKYQLQRFLQVMYHIISVVTLDFLLILIYFVLTH